jgi:hypothetical protein
VSFQHGSNADFYLGGYNGTGYCSSVSVEGEIETAEVTTLGKTAKNYIPGLEDATISFEGYFDSSPVDSAAFSYKLDALRRTITEATYIPQSDLVGGTCHFAQGMLTSYSLETPVDDAGSFEAEMQSKTAWERGVTLHTLGARTSTANGTTVDQSAGSTAGASALLQVTSVSGTAGPSLTVVVQHSTDGSTWADLITFGTKTAASTSERAAVTGTVNRYVRAIWTITGTTPSFTFHVAFSRKK